MRTGETLKQTRIGRSLPGGQGRGLGVEGISRTQTSFHYPLCLLPFAPAASSSTLALESTSSSSHGPVFPGSARNPNPTA